MPEKKQKINHIAIVGAGLVGSLVAILLRNRGYRISVFERRQDPRKSEFKGGRSINLALSNRGWLPLEQAGIIDRVQQMIIPMNGRMMHSLEGQLTFQPYGKPGQAINSVSRSGLNELLIETAEESGVEFHFDRQCSGLDTDSTTLILNENGKVKENVFDLIIGADGAFSVVRSAFQEMEHFDYSQDYISHGYKELNIPSGPEGNFKLEKNALHIWPRGNFMLIALPNIDGSFTVTIFLPFEGINSFNALSEEKHVEEFFKEQFPDAHPLLENLKTDWTDNPTSSLVTVRCFPWHQNKTLIIGDAAHAVVPFYGQGMNCGFEDCRVLNDMLEEFNDNWELLLPAYQEYRKTDADAIADLALQNFIEMRDLVADEDFLLRKKIESRIHSLFPDEWIPLYSMVTFNEMLRYSDAKKTGIKQSKIMDEVMSIENIREKWETLDFQKIVDKLSDSA